MQQHNAENLPLSITLSKGLVCQLLENLINIGVIEPLVFFAQAKRKCGSRFHLVVGKRPQPKGELEKV
jgi:hypothetical protein